MRLYSHCIFPRVIEFVMSREPLASQRPRVLADVSGTVLEIGFGTGLNLPHYPQRVERLLVLDPNPGMRRLAKRRIAASPLAVEFIDLVDGKKLTLPDHAVDNVVSTWTMCSIADVPYALAEIHRVLQPGGRFFFIEHGLSPDPGVALWQRRLNFINRRIGDGCNLDRDISGLLAASPLTVERCEKFYLPKAPRIGGYTYRGAARKEPQPGPALAVGDQGVAGRPA